MPLVSLLVIAACAFIIWHFVVKDRMRSGVSRPQAVATAATTDAPEPPQVAPASAPPSPASDAIATEGSTRTDAAPSAQPDPVPTAAATGVAGGFTVQVMSAKDQASSQAAADRLASHGAEAYVMRADLGARGVWYRVRIGQFSTRAEAQAAATRLRSSGRIQSAIIVPYEPGQ
jgi:cell division septation protein DedD